MSDSDFEELSINFDYQDFDEKLKRKYGVYNTDVNGNLADLIFSDELKDLATSADSELKKFFMDEDLIKCTFRDDSIFIEVDNYIINDEFSDGNSLSTSRGEIPKSTDMIKEDKAKQCLGILQNLADNQIKDIDKKKIINRLITYK